MEGTDVERQLVAALARRLLPEVDAMADELVRRIHAEDPDYARADRVGDAELRQACGRNLLTVIGTLAGTLPDGEDQVRASRETGRRRATQGMPLESVLHAYRIGGQLIWARLVAAARAADADPVADGLLAAAGAVWTVIDRYSTALAEAYRREEDRVSDQHLRQQQQTLAVLLSEGDADAATLEGAGAVLGVLPDARLACAVVLLDDPLAPRADPTDLLLAHGFASTWTSTEVGSETGLLHLGTRPLADAVRALAVQQQGRGGVSPVVRGLSGLRQARDLALLAAGSLRAGIPATAAVESRLPQALLQAGALLVPSLHALTVDPLLARGRSGQVLLDTVRAYLAHCGSLSRTAAALFCHRNTVDYRLSRVAELCPRGVTDAEGQLLWRLALLGLDQRR